MVAVNERTPKLLTYKEAAEILNVAPITLRRWKSEKRIPFVEVGSRAIRFDPQVLRDWISEQSVPVGGRK